jgi:hypothetical protein
VQFVRQYGREKSRCPAMKATFDFTISSARSKSGNDREKLNRGNQTASFFVYWDETSMGKEAVFLQIVVVKSPKLLCGLLKSIFRMK